MPSNYGVTTNNRIRSAGGITMANNWADLLDGSIANDINTLFAGSFGSQYTGCDSTNTGAIDAARNCNGFTDGSGGTLGTAAQPAATGATWMGTGFGSCSNSFGLLCLAFD